jgi:hypothetical protein
MNKTKLSTLLISAAALVGGFFAYGETVLVKLPDVVNVDTNTTVTVTSPFPHTGIVRAISIDGLNTGTVAIATVAGTGFSTSTARTILASDTQIDLYTNLAATVWLGQDRIRATCSNSATNDATYTIYLIIDK